MSLSAEERRSILERARLAEEAGRWDDMVTYMKALVVKGRDLSVEERNMFANAYKNYVGQKRASWRVVSGIEQKIGSSNRRRDLSREYRTKIEEELKVCCNEVLSLIEQHLLNTIDTENRIFYLKMQGDYFRYLSEFSRDTISDGVFERAKVAYATAFEQAKENLSPAHPLRLGLILNFSVFHHEILESHETGCEMAREAVAAAADETNSLPESMRNDSTLIIQLMKDNIKIWSVEIESQNQLQKTTTVRYH
ncbi:14-3-3 protein zeta-like [Mya arenaria]|uniref:14-3-3 protein zeta-like n=1 Tax=Mya arenaria TaxID=6604 RepID=UPI0022DFF75F|nr:14-3-3 protein zeta-like [Mya arenaria]